MKHGSRNKYSITIKRIVNRRFQRFLFMIFNVLFLTTSQMSFGRLVADFCRLSVGRQINLLARREISLSPIVLDSIRDAHRQGTKLDGASRVI